MAIITLWNRAGVISGDKGLGMKLTDIVQELVIAEAKITQYLLNEEHDKGRPKAKFFLGVGFHSSDWRGLADVLETLAREEEIIDSEQREYGVFYGIEGTIPTPNGQTRRIRTVWVVKTQEQAANLVTAYSRRKKR